MSADRMPAKLFSADGKRVSKRLRLWLWWDDVRDWCARWIFAQHNARVIIDFERRMSSVIQAASGGMMSKSYYTEETMLAEIAANESRLWDDAYAEGRKDLLEELGIPDPNAELAD